MRSLVAILFVTAGVAVASPRPHPDPLLLDNLTGGLLGQDGLLGGVLGQDGLLGGILGQESLVGGLLNDLLGPQGAVPGLLNVLLGESGLLGGLLGSPTDDTSGGNVVAGENLLSIVSVILRLQFLDQLINTVISLVPSAGLRIDSGTINAAVKKTSEHWKATLLPQLNNICK